MGCGAELVKFILILFNFLCMICSAALLFFCYPLFKHIPDFATMKEHVHVEVVAIAPMVLGGILFLVALIGCCGALRGSPCQLRTFSFIMVCLFVGVLVLGIYLWADYDKLAPALEKFIKEIWNEHKENEVAEKIMHRFEITAKCCGIDGAKSYMDHHEAIPPSCCGQSSGVCDASHIYNIGCMDQMKGQIETHAKLVKFGALAASGVTLLASSFASYLAHQMSPNYESY